MITGKDDRMLELTAISTLEMDRESAETSENGVCNEESTEASEIVEREEALA